MSFEQQREQAHKLIDRLPTAVEVFPILELCGGLALIDGRRADG